MVEDVLKGGRVVLVLVFNLARTNPYDLQRVWEVRWSGLVLTDGVALGEASELSGVA